MMRTFYCGKRGEMQIQGRTESVILSTDVFQAGAKSLP